MYVAGGTESGLGLHWDEHDVVVVQLEGRRRWSLGSLASNAPLRERLQPHGLGAVEPDRPAEVGAIDITLDPGDVLVVPRGTWHRVEGTGDRSAHVSFGFDYPLGLDVLAHHGSAPPPGDEVAARAARTEARRSEGPWSWPPLSVAGADGLWPSALAEIVGGRQVRPPGCITEMVSALTAEDLVGWTHRWWGSEAAVAEPRGGEPAAAVGGVVVRFSPALLACLEVLCAPSPRPVEDLTARLGERLPASDDHAEITRVALCELALDGLVELTPPGTPDGSGPR